MRKIARARGKTVSERTCRYVATELVKQLLEKGYNVRGTLRSLASEEKYSHLLALGNALPGKLTLHEVGTHLDVDLYQRQAKLEVSNTLLY